MIERRRTQNIRKETKTSQGSSGDWSRARLVFVGVLFGCIWLLLWARAWYIQTVQSDWLAENAAKQQRATELRVGRRGDILDRNGQVLARSVEVRSVFARPVEITDQSAAIKILCNVLGEDERHWRRMIASKRQFVWLSRKITDHQAQTLKEAVKEEKIKGLYLTKEYNRVYPFKQLAGQVLGFVGVDDKGLEGLEKAFDDYMTGSSGKAVVQRDAAGRRLYLEGVPDADLEGRDLHLTIDATIQYFAEESLAKAITQYNAKWGGCLVVDVPTGDILAWAEVPFFNPNAYREYKPAAWRSRLALDAMEQGSTIKPFVVAAALTEGRAKPDSLYYCEKGKWKFKNVPIRDTSSYEWLTVNKIIRYSSNIGAAKIGLDLGVSKLHDYLTRLGFGSRTSLPLLGESKGILREPGQWTEVDLAAASFGQSFAATGVQMAQAYLVLASGGVLRPLKLVTDADARIENQDRESGGFGPQVAQAAEGPRIFSEEVTHQIALMMSEVVTEGSGKRARIAGVSVSGKTGTAQKAEGASYGEGRMASFAGFIPAENPRYLILVLIDEPTKSVYGGVVAAPVFRYVGTRIMAYRNELPDLGTGMPGQRAVAAGPGTAVSASGSPDAAPRAEGDGNPISEDVIPDVCGKSVRGAMELFTRKGIVPRVRGNGQIIVRQEPKAGTPWSAAGGGDGKKTEFTLWLGEQS